MKINTLKRVLQISIFSVWLINKSQCSFEGGCSWFSSSAYNFTRLQSLSLVSVIETLNHHNIITLCVPHDANSVASEKQPLKGVLIRKKLLNPKSTKPKHVLGSFSLLTIFNGIFY